MGTASYNQASSSSAELVPFDIRLRPQTAYDPSHGKRNYGMINAGLVTCISHILPSVALKTNVPNARSIMVSGRLQLPKLKTLWAQRGGYLRWPAISQALWTISTTSIPPGSVTTNQLEIPWNGSKVRSHRLLADSEAAIEAYERCKMAKVRGDYKIKKEARA